ncbi:rhomboid family intramembrane serine protease [Candidatus Pacearchaeota archaeon]|nr:rhomboid family intramembrane serine protease [Candidatus Pacearchaeota archaeon]
MERKVFSTYTGILVLLNIVAFLIFLFWSYYSGDQVIRNFALQPSLILQGKNLWTIITSMFLHAGIGHIAANMISLIFLGGFVEKLIGKKRFLGLYFIGGLVASLFFVIFAGFFGTTVAGAKFFGSPESFAVGASGAIFALGGLLAVLTPRLKVLVFFIIPMQMWIAMIALTVLMWMISLGLPINIGNTAHLGGLVAGVVYGFYLKRKYPRKTQMISRYFSN